VVTLENLEEHEIFYLVRRKNKKTHTEFAKKLGWTKSTYGKFERYGVKELIKRGDVFFKIKESLKNITYAEICVICRRRKKMSVARTSQLSGISFSAIKQSEEGVLSPSRLYNFWRKVYEM
jgi:transcriptional regulator with XRE-family HTH domain